MSEYGIWNLANECWVTWEENGKQVGRSRFINEILDKYLDLKAYNVPNVEIRQFKEEHEYDIGNK